MPERLTVTPRQFFPCLVSPEPLEVVSLSQTAAPFAGFLWTGTGGGGRDAWSADDWAAQLGQADIANYVVYAAGEPVGCFELEVMPGEGVRLNHLGVMPGYGDEGHAEAMLTLAVERAFSFDGSLLAVITEDSNLLGLYGQQGFRPDRTRNEESP